MNASDDSSLRYTCPHCQNRMKARPADVGQRRECPRCGKMVKVPGPLRDAKPHGPTQSPSEPAAAHTSPVIGRGVGSLSVICPVCGTRIYATTQQLGTTIVCPDCLESVVVSPPERPVSSDDGAIELSSEKSPKKHSGRRAPDDRLLSDRSDAGEEAEDTIGKDDDDSDELKLSDPITIPKEIVLPKDLLDLQQHEQSNRASGRRPPVRSGGTDQHPPADSTNLPPGSSDERPPDPRPYSVKCPVCDTMIQATESEIGKQVTCPDCGSLVPIRRRRPNPRASAPVDLDPDAGDEFRLSDPVDLEVYRDAAAKATAAPSFGQQALDDAERQQHEKEQGQIKLPKHPLWDGLFVFLKNPEALIRWAALTVVVVAVGLLTLWSLLYANKGGAALMLALITSVGTLAVFVFGGAYAVVNCLAILEETANGYDMIREWPEVNIIEWLFDSFFMVMALFYSLTPGILLASALSCAGLPTQLSSMIIGLSLFFLFPIVQLSMLESGSLGTPFTTPIVKSIGEQWRLWAAFYGITGAVFLTVGIVGLVVKIKPSFSLTLVLMSVVWSLGLLMYYRMLGRLAWACRERGALDEGATDSRPDRS